MDIALLRDNFKKIKLVFDNNEKRQLIVSRDFLICSNHNYSYIIPLKIPITKGDFYYVENEFLEIVLKDKSSSGNLSISDSQMLVSFSSGFETSIPVEKLNIDLIACKPGEDHLMIPVPYGFINRISQCKGSVLKTTELSPYSFAWCLKDKVFSSTAEVINCSFLSEDIDRFEDVFSLSIKNIDILKKINPVEYKVSDSWVIFKTMNGETLYIRRYNFDCPVRTLEEYLNFKTEYFIKFDERASSNIDQFLVINGKNNQHVKVKVKNEKAEISTVGTKIKGILPVLVECNVEDEFEFYINPKTFRSCLETSKEMMINKELNGARFTGNKNDVLIGLGVN